MRHLQRFSISLLVFLVLNACTTIHPSKDNISNENIGNEIIPGDQIKIISQAGDQRLITVTSISDGYVISKEGRFKLEDIEIMEIKRLNMAGNVAVVGAFVFMQALITAIILGLAL